MIQIRSLPSRRAIWTQTGANNTAVGLAALEYNTIGANNVALGYRAGYSGIATSAGNGNIFLGYNTGATVEGLTNATAIGTSALVSESNAIVLGAPGTNVGIGTSNPLATLDVNGGVRAGTSTAVTTCGSGQANGEGTQRYNYTTHYMEYCNGPLGPQLRPLSTTRFSPHRVRSLRPQRQSPVRFSNSP